ncbi:MAG: Gfo/Idh/MocA family oxidoreductase [Chloroflexota bacterium]
MTAAGRVGIGVLGCGRMGSAHARIIAGLVPQARLVALGDVQVDAAHRLAAELDGPRVHDSAEALAADPDVQAVLVAVSSSRHLDAVRAIAAAGKDILCEKPLALTLPETDAAIAATDAAGVRLQVAFMRRHDPDHRRAKERLASGALGRPFLFQSLQLDMEPPPLAFCDPRVSGGIFVDMGIHEFDLARWLMDDEVDEVTAYGSTLSHPELATVGDVDSAVAILRFASGATGTVTLGRDTTYGEDVRTEVTATAGSVWLGSLQPGHGAVSGPNAITRDFLDPAIPRFERAYAEQTRAFVRAIAEGRPVSVTGHDSRAALVIALAADRSMREGRPVRVAEVATPPGR